MQDSIEWLNWRSEGIGSSDIPVLFGLCPYRKYEELLIEKIHPDKTQERKTGYIQELGHQWEVVLRNKIFFEKGIEYTPKLFVDKENPYLRVSLDGYSPEKNNFIEIKLTGKVKYESILKNIIPDNFLYQIQYQLAVTGCKECFLWAVRYDRDKELMGKDIVHKKVKQNKDLQEKILVKVKQVWEIILENRKK